MAEKSRKSLADSLLKSVKKATRKDETIAPVKPSKSLVDKPKYTQGQGLGDVELRAELEPFMYGNPLARLGYELYKEGEIDIKAMDDMARGEYGLYVPQSMTKAMGVDKPTVTYRSTPGLSDRDKKRLPYGPSEYFENISRELNIDPRMVLVHELTHAAFDVLEKELGEKSGVEEGIVRAGDELITGRTSGTSGTMGAPGLKNLLQDANIPFTPKNERILKKRYLKHSLQAQDILNKRGIPPEAVAPSDNRNPARINKLFNNLLGFEQERNKLNYLGFAQPLEDTVLGIPTKEDGALYTKDVNYFGDTAIKAGTLDPSRAGVIGEGPTYLPKNMQPRVISNYKEGGALMAKTGLMPLTEATSNPTGNKRTKPPKIPRAAAATKVVDPRDEALKLVAKKLKDDKTQVGIPQPVAPTPVVSAQQPMMTAGLAAPMMPQQEITTMKEGGTKSKKGKGLAVVIGMSGEQPEYEEASKGTPADPPPGATSDEVKDDQQVLLSEGELVVPANVVRYHGLGMYEGLRREALRGLGEMEDAGQVEYIDDGIKTAQAGMTILDAPNVATSQGIARQQQQYNPALGQFGTATVPQAASSRFVRAPGFTDTNRDGIDDKLQPSVRGLVSPTTTTGAISPASLTLGPVTDPNVVVGAGNVGSYQQDQTYKPGDSTPPPADDAPAPVAPSRVVQQDSGDGGGGDPEIDAGLGGARTSIGGKDYAIQYDFSGNITGIADVKEALATGRANYFAPNPELTGLINTQTTGQKALGLAAFAPVANAFGFLEDNKASIDAGKAATAALNSYRGEVGMRSQDMPMGRPSKDVMQAYATEKPATQPIDYSNVLSTTQQNKNTQGLAAPQVTNVTDVAQQSLAEKGTVASNISPEITTVGSRQGGIGRFSSAGDVMGKQSYQDAYDKYSTQFAAGMGPTGTKPGTTQSYNANLNALNTIAQNAITPEERLAANHVAQDIQMDRISQQSLGRSYDNRSIAEQAELERGFNVDETFGSGINPGEKEVNENFSDRGKDAVSANGGSVGIGRTDNGSKYSINSNGTFSFSNGTTTNVTDSRGNPINDPDAGKAGPDQTDPESQGKGAGGVGDPEGGGAVSGGSTSSSATAGQDTATSGPTGTSYADDAQASGSGPGGKIVCTEMYRQTQLDDWSQAMKTWHIYQKKYLTPLHEIGYHSLFKPFVRGMKVNNTLTSIGAYFAKERTKHLRHILTKGKAKDSMVGNIFCKIIHPIVYLVGLAVHKK